MSQRTVIRSLLVFVLLLSVCVSMTSCFSFRANDYVTRDELQGAMQNGSLNSSLDNAHIEGGDNYNIVIENSGSPSLASAGKALLSSVSITCNFKIRKGYTVSTAQSHGSGVIYSIDKSKGDAIIITNYHVVYDSSCSTSNRISDEISVNLYGMENEAYDIPAVYVGGSMNYDLAVLKISDSSIIAESSAIPITFGDSDQVSVLDTVVAIGNAAGEGISATVGHINVDSENIAITMGSTTSAKEIPLRVMRIDAAVNSGNSGGGLFDLSGNLVGIVNAKMASSSYDNIGYAIPSNVVKYIAKNVLDYCLDTDRESVYRCMLGITVGCNEMYAEFDTDNGKVYKREVVAVAKLESSSIAVGKLKVGDVINSITIDGQTYAVTRKHHVVDVMLNARVGSVVELDITRDGATVSESFTITEDCVAEY